MNTEEIDVTMALTLFDRMVVSASRHANAALANRDGEKHGYSTATDGGYMAIPLSSQGFISEMKMAMRHVPKPKHGGKPKFLDVGCGVGDKVLMASYLFKLDAYGIELRSDIHEMACALIGTTRIEQCDALKYQKYDQYDVIYFYRPAWQGELQAKLENLILSTAKPGAVLVGVYSSITSEVCAKHSWKYRKNSVWTKQK